MSHDCIRFESSPVLSVRVPMLLDGPGRADLAVMVTPPHPDPAPGASKIVTIVPYNITFPRRFGHGKVIRCHVPVRGKWVCWVLR